MTNEVVAAALAVVGVMIANIIRIDDAADRGIDDGVFQDPGQCVAIGMDLSPRCSPSMR